jgi:hypothetical protein
MRQAGFFGGLVDLIHDFSDINRRMALLPVKAQHKAVFEFLIPQLFGFFRVCGLGQRGPEFDFGCGGARESLGSTFSFGLKMNQRGSPQNACADQDAFRGIPQPTEQVPPATQAKRIEASDGAAEETFGRLNRGRDAGNRGELGCKNKLKM